jgi:protocatechuate 3,4-dioxygenase beta subunit
MFARGLRFTLPGTTTGLLAAALLFAFDSALANSEPPPAEPSAKQKLIDLWRSGDSGQRMNIRGRVTGLDGSPLSGINIEIRQPDGDGNWSEQYRTTLTTDAQGRYQFGSVVPQSNYCGDPHVEVTVYQDGWEYFDRSIVFDVDPETYYGDGTPIFLEESTVKDETIMFGRFDIVLSPE